MSRPKTKIEIITDPKQLFVIEIVLKKDLEEIKEKIKILEGHATSKYEALTEIRVNKRYVQRIESNVKTN